ncbi:LysR family transcriptional regulator [Actinomadura rupiterrae]|uniref:LysR family transcriptional regulator n=1 Tax=Actinomadura rupiterrae TaxID=559627 RepID=UPI0020A329B1|nr:LysR family transcriptional regulator [Actinomadura rupiterrae]MCP2338412.1 DNA-binding transcriptional LysR family regulator [Actinomadura rupiterrae]
MDVDVPGLRAFVAAAEEMHFGRAARRLFLTQQALSQRVRRLESVLGAPLFERTTRRVELTDAGRRLLPRAREALSAVDAVVAAVRGEPQRLRVDVYDQRFSPMTLVRGLLDLEPRVRVEISMRQGFEQAVPALLSGEIDAAFGQARDLPGRWPPELSSRVVQLVPLHAFVAADHPLAARETMRPDELRDHGIVMPDPVAAESRAFLNRIADRFDVPIRFVEPAVGLWHYGELVAREAPGVALGEAGVEVPKGTGLHRIRLVDPVPLVPWCLTWRSGDTSAALKAVLRALPPAVPPPPDDPSHWLADAYRD